MNDQHNNPFAPRIDTQANGDIARYLNRVAPWGGEHYFSIHHISKNKAGKIIIPGNAHKELAPAIEDVEYWLGKEVDIYLAMCGQKNIKQLKKGWSNNSPYPRADRSRINTTCCKNLYLDMDVKPNEPDEAYATTKDLVEAFNNFLNDIPLLPFPSLGVLSGTGGLHIYWVLKQVISISEWEPIANALVVAGLRHGLKFDTECTSDPTRLLRVPDTFNYKLRNTGVGGPLPVKLHWDDGPDIDLEQITEALTPYIDAPRSRTPKSSAHTQDARTQSILLEGEQFSELSGGIKPEYQPSDIDDVAKNCPFIDETLKTGGAEHAEPVWFRTISLAARCTDPEGTAHRLSKGYEDYSPEETLAKLAQAQLARKNNPNLGPPSCKDISLAEASQCATCQYRDLGSNPLNVGFHTLGNMPEAPLVGRSIGGGVYPPQQMLAMMNTRYAIVRFNESGEINIVRHDGKYPIVMRREQDIKLELANVYVKHGAPDPNDNTEVITSPQLAYRWWRGNKKRDPVREEVFNSSKLPGAACGPDEFNFWSGFAIDPIEGEDKIQRLLDHLKTAVCNGDQNKFDYLIRLHAWKIQHPDQSPEVSMLLNTTGEGSGKSLLAVVMKKIFGRHALIVDDIKLLLGDFDGHLEHCCYIAVEEALFAGDMRACDKLKARVTSPVLTLNAKFRQARSVPNLLFATFLSNHGHVVQAGKGARRYFILEGSEERMGDTQHFNAIFNDLENGGYGQFLNCMLNSDLKKWHPRELLRTLELSRQQLMSLLAGPRHIWECADSGRIIGGPYTEKRLLEPLPKLGEKITLAAMRIAHNDWARDRGLRPENIVVLGRMWKQVFGAKKRASGEMNQIDRPWYYDLPQADELKEKILKLQGILHSLKELGAGEEETEEERKEREQQENEERKKAKRGAGGQEQGKEGKRAGGK